MPDSDDELLQDVLAGISLPHLQGSINALPQTAQVSGSLIGRSSSTARPASVRGRGPGRPRGSSSTARPASVRGRGPGRPRGSSSSSARPASVRGRGPGRPRGSASSSARPVSVRGRGPGRPRGSASSTANRSGRNSTAQSFAHKWKLLPDRKSYRLMYERDLRSLLVDSKTVAHFKSVQDKTRQRVRIVSPSNCFMYLANQTITKLLEWANVSQQGVNGIEIQKWEFLAWVAQHLYSGLMANFAADQCERYLKSNDVPITISRERYNEIFARLTPFDPELNAQSTGSGVDDVLKLRELTQLAFTKSFQIFVDENFRGTKDDEMVGSRASDIQKKQHAERKGKRWGFKSDVLAAICRAIVAVRYQEYGYKQERAVTAMLDRFSDCCASSGTVNTRNMSISTDRGYSAEYLWEKCAYHGFGCNLIVDEKRLLGHPIIGVSQSAATKLPPKYRVGDDVRFGDAIFTAERVYKHKSRSTANRVKIAAFAVRQHARSRNKAKNHVAQILRFVVSDNTKLKLLRSTYTLVPKPKLTNAEQDLVLFYPEANLENKVDKVAAEQYLRRVIVPLTAAQRTADWFLLRRFRVTGTMAAKIARKDTNANLLLSSTAERNELGNQFSADTRSGTTSQQDTQPALAGESMAQGTEASTTLPSESESQGSVEHSSVDSDEDGSQSDVASVSSGGSNQMAEEESLPISDESEVSSCSEDEVEALPIAFDDDVFATDEEVYDHFINSWFGRSFNRTAAMRIGTVNEDRVVVSLRMQGWVEFLFDIGLVARKDKPWLAVSADGFAKIHLPDSQSVVYAAVEIKTRSARIAIEAAQKISDDFGFYFDCVVGDATWWKVVPWEYRGQVIHQAVVLGVEHVLFVVATQTRISYCCVVEVPEVDRKTFEDALDRYETFLAWPHSSSAKLPDSLQLNDTMSQVLKTNLPLWRSMVKFIADSGMVCKPLRVIHAAVATNYSIQKGGIDGATQYAERVCNKSIRYKWGQKVVARTLVQLLVNSHIMYRITKNFDPQTFQTLDKFQEKCNANSLTFSQFAEAVCVGLLVQANRKRLQLVQERSQHFEQQQHITQSLVAQNSTANDYNYDDFRYPGRNRLSYFNRGIGKLVRLDVNAEHLTGIVPDRKRKRCVVCENPTRNICTRCKAPLCLYRVTQRKCFRCFHVKDTVCPEDANAEMDGNVSPINQSNNDAIAENT